MVRGYFIWSYHNLQWSYCTPVFLSPMTPIRSTPVHIFKDFTIFIGWILNVLLDYQALIILANHSQQKKLFLLPSNISCEWKLSPLYTQSGRTRLFKTLFQFSRWKIVPHLALIFLSWTLNLSMGWKLLMLLPPWTLWTADKVVYNTIWQFKISGHGYCESYMTERGFLI